MEGLPAVEITSAPKCRAIWIALSLSAGKKLVHTTGMRSRLANSITVESNRTVFR